MGGIPRTLISALVAVGVTLGLFWFMYFLIGTGSGRQEDLEPIAGIRFGPVEIPDEIQTKKRRIPKKPPPPKQPPPPPKMTVQKVQQQQQQMPRLDVPNLDVPMVAGAGIYLGAMGQIDVTEEGDIIPIVRIEPQIPREALLSGISGWVKVEFTITPTGTVKNPRVIEAKPARIFNREAVRAILKWKFKPRVVNGQAVERQATQIIDFKVGG